MEHVRELDHNSVKVGDYIGAIQWKWGLKETQVNVEIVSRITPKRKKFYCKSGHVYTDKTIFVEPKEEAIREFQCMERRKNMRAINIEWDNDGDEMIAADLPKEIEIPKELAENTDPDDYEEEISDYISDQTGFCHFGFELVED